MLTVDALRARPVGGLNQAAPATRPLHQLGWIAAPATEPSAVGWLELTELPAEGEPVPDFLAVRCTVPAGDPAAAARELTVRTLGLVQSFLTGERFAGSRLVLLTTGATDPAGSQALPAGAVWGLVRAAAAEYPDRLALVDADQATEELSPALAGLIEAGEWQLAVRDGALLVPRLAPVTHADSPANTADLASGTVLVTGGTGGLGALVAERLVTEHGVRNLLLLSRSGPAAAGAAELVERLTGLGAEVTVHACDVSDRAALAAAIGDRRLSGVVHASAVTDDAALAGLTAEQVAVAFGPKVDAAWHLHELTAGHDLAAFVLFSSLAGLIGTAGQGNYAAANGFLDSLAGYRRAHGQPATSVAWGLWDVVTGLTGQLADADRARLARGGVVPLSSEHGLAMFDQALSGETGAVLAGAAWDSAGLRKQAESGRLAPVLRDFVRLPRRASAASSGSPIDLAAQLGRLDEPAGRQLIAELVRAQVAAVLGHGDAGSVPADRTFAQLGFDSLTGVELRNRLDGATGLRLPATLAFDYPTVTALSEFVHQTLAPAPPPPDEALQASIDQISLALDGHDEDTRSRVVAVLHSALARLAGDTEAASGVQATLSDASDDEIFAFIDNQL